MLHLNINLWGRWISCRGTGMPLLFILEHYYVQRERERNYLFNDALNTFYLRLYGVRHMVKDHSDSEKGNPLPPHRLLLSINIAQWVHPIKDGSDDSSHHERTLYL